MRTQGATRVTHWSVLLATFALMLCACSEAARHTVEEYRASAELRHEQISRCEKDPGTLRDTPDCINARHAAAFEDRVRLRDLPPIGLDVRERKTESRSTGGASGDRRSGGRADEAR
jgi:hypothetical protein